MVFKLSESFIKIKKFFKIIWDKILLCFSLKNLYVIFLISLWPALFFYFKIFSPEKQNLAFLILGIVALSVALIFLFTFKNRQPGILTLFSFLLSGFLGIRLIEFFLVGEEVDQILEETIDFYTTTAFILLSIYLIIKVFKHNYNGKIVALTAVFFSLLTIFLLNEISHLNHEKQDFQNQANRLFKTVMLYEFSPPSSWKTYFNYHYNFILRYPPNFSDDFIEKNISLETEKIKNYISNRPHLKIKYDTGVDYINYRDDVLLNQFWTSDCIQKLANNQKKFLLFRGRI